MRLEKRESNMLFEKIVEADLDPADFLLIAEAKWPGVTHIASGSFALIKPHFWNTSNYKLRTLVAPGRESYLTGLTWRQVIENVSEWCGQLKAPNLWAELQRAHEIPGEADEGETDNTPFTAEELADISRQLAQIKKYLEETVSLTAQQVSRVNERLDEAERASKRMGRKDWLLLFSGTILTLIVTDLVSPDVAHHIFAMALNGLRHLFGAIPSTNRELP